MNRTKHGIPARRIRPERSFPPTYPLAWAKSALLALALIGAARPASAAITYIQGADQDPSSASSVAVTYASAQTAGDLNVVVVGWNSSGTINSITDTEGNTYVEAVSTSAYGTTLVTYYAQNVAAASAGANTVTVTFSTSVHAPDMRVLEYSGISKTNALDVEGGASGTGTATSSGPVTTANANDVLVASVNYQDAFSAVGSGYTERILSHPDANLVEDELVTSTGSYTATSTQGAADEWVMQVAAFRASSGDNSPPTAPTNLTANAIASSQVNLSWTASTDNVGVTGYYIQRCSGSGCSDFAQIGTSTTTAYNDTGRSPSTSYSYRVQATDAAGNLSAFSNTASATTPASTAITYIQGADQDPTSASSVSVTYASAQTAGDLNILVVGWNSSGAINSITDTKGNTYMEAASTSASGTMLVTYYAQNIAAAGAGANTVTVTFSTSVHAPDVRVLEYSGISTTDAFDVGGGATGTGVTSNSGSVTTTNANDLLVGSNMVQTDVTAAGSGYTERILSDPDANLVEDEVVTSAGSYSATSTLASGFWVQQITAFRGASGDTSPPTTPTNLTATAVSSSQINLSWTASTDNVGVTGYYVQRCAGSGCSNFAQIGTSTSAAYNDTGLSASTSYSYRVQATDAAGNLSGFSGAASASTDSSGGGNCVASATNPFTYTYSSTRQLQTITTASGCTAQYTYDANGNLTGVQVTQ